MLSLFFLHHYYLSFQSDVLRLARIVIMPVGATWWLTGSAVGFSVREALSRQQ